MASEKNGGSYRDMLGEILTKREYEEMVKGYDILGNIAILDIPKSLRKKEKKIADIIMKIHPSVKTVMAKAGAISGKLRIRGFRHVAGEKNKIATYRENNCVFKFDITRTFFSNRLSFERKRIVDLVKDKEKVLVLFSGVGPFSVEIAKAHPGCKVVGVELNKYASKAAEENVVLNKVTNVKCINADVRKATSKLKNSADRMIVPMPTASLGFLDEISVYAKKRAVVHLYSFGAAETVFADIADRLGKHAKANDYNIQIISKRVVGSYSSREIEVVIDYIIKK